MSSPLRNMQILKNTGIYEWIYRGDDLFGEYDDASSPHDTSVWWVNNSPPQSHVWESDSSEENIVTTIRKKKEQHKFRVAGVQLPLKINGKKTKVWIDSGSPISIFTISELPKRLGKTGIKWLLLGSKDDQFRDYGNNPLKFMGKMKATLTKKRWSAETYIKMIGGADRQ